MDESLENKNDWTIDLLAKFITYLVAIMLFLAGDSRKPVTLLDLQTRYLKAKSEEQREKVLDQVKRYYLTLEVPDSLRQNVDAAVQTMINRTKIDLADRDPFFEEVNYYKREKKLQALLETAMVVRLRRDAGLYDKLITQALKFAEILDQRSRNRYWIEFVAEVNAYSLREVEAWLKSNVALKLCMDIVDQNYLLGEAYAALGLQELSAATDEKKRLHIWQRLQTIIYSHYELNELSIAIAERSLEQARAMRDTLRITGVTHHKAEALAQNGQIEAALEQFRIAAKYSAVCDECFYRKNSLIQTAICYWQLGRFEETLFLCDEIEQICPSQDVSLHLYNTRGLAHKGLGNYEIADSEYKKALDLAIEQGLPFNEVRCLNNLGNLYFKLTDYDQALVYLNQARAKLLSDFNPKNYQRYINVLVDMANVMAESEQYAKVDSLISEVQNLSKQQGISPLRKAEFLETLAEFNQQHGRFRDALRDLQEAVEICEEYGLDRISQGHKVRMAECYIAEGEFDKATMRLNEVLGQADAVENFDIRIEALALLAEIQRKETNWTIALSISTEVVDMVDAATDSIRNQSLMMAFRQKVYSYLKKNAIDKIQTGDSTNAFVKLGQAKARALRIDSRLSNSSSPALNDIRELEERLRTLVRPETIVMDYLIAEEALYVFVLDNKGLEVFFRDIKKSELAGKVADYVAGVREAPVRFNNDNSQNSMAYFDHTIDLSSELFDELLGWILSKPRYEKVDTIYVIPDEFLFGLPFSTLAKKSANGLSFMAEDIAIVVSPSSYLLEEPKGKPLPFANKKILLSVDTRETSIPGGEAFLLSLRKQFPNAEVLATTSASLTQRKQEILEQLSQGYDTIIVFGHGQADKVFPDSSSINFAMIDKSGKVESVRMTLAELKSIEWMQTGLVMLIGCETGDGKVYNGTGIAGLQQVFVSLGVEHVLASLWKIDSANTIDQMTRFVKEWQLSFDPVLALQKTQRSVVNELGQNPFYEKPHPYLWGAYTLYSKSVQSSREKEGT